jgi:putative ABC transport system substrate-binding protein
MPIMGFLASSHRATCGTLRRKDSQGMKPAELPVMHSIKYPLVINLKTAKALGFDIPAKVLAIADEVIE